MDQAYKTVELVQGTPEWRLWRDGGIGASDAPTIMGENPWCRPDRLLLEKVGKVRGFAGNALTARGAALEPHARMHYETLRRIKVAPRCLQSERMEWMRASVDGLSEQGNVVVEIKCGDSAYQRTTRSRQVPEYYVGQLQHILAVTGLPEIDFFCWLPEMPPITLCVKRDERYIARMIKVEKEFWRKVQDQRG